MFWPNKYCHASAKLSDNSVLVHHYYPRAKNCFLQSHWSALLKGHDALSHSVSHFADVMALMRLLLSPQLFIFRPPEAEVYPPLINCHHNNIAATHASSSENLPSYTLIIGYCECWEIAKKIPTITNTNSLNVL